MSSTIILNLIIFIIAIALLSVNFILAPHNPYIQKNNPFECGYVSFISQNRTQFSISYFIFGLLFLLFDLEILLVYPYLVSSNINEILGLSNIIIFLLVLIIGFGFEYGKEALTIDSRQHKDIIKENNNYIGNNTEFKFMKANFMINPLFNKVHYITVRRFTTNNILFTPDKGKAPEVLPEDTPTSSASSAASASAEESNTGSTNKEKTLAEIDDIEEAKPVFTDTVLAMEDKVLDAEQIEDRLDQYEESCTEYDEEDPEYHETINALTEQLDKCEKAIDEYKAILDEALAKFGNELKLDGIPFGPGTEDYYNNSDTESKESDDDSTSTIKPTKHNSGDDEDDGSNDGDGSDSGGSSGGDGGGSNGGDSEDLGEGSSTSNSGEVSGTNNNANIKIDIDGISYLVTVLEHYADPYMYIEQYNLLIEIYNNHPYIYIILKLCLLIFKHIKIKWSYLFI